MSNVKAIDIHTIHIQIEHIFKWLHIQTEYRFQKDTDSHIQKGCILKRMHIQKGYIFEKDKFIFS